MKKLLALAMLLVLCAVLTGLLTGCKVSAANTMMTDGVPKVAVTSPDVPVISTKWTERQYTVSEPGRDGAAHRPISDPRADPHRQSRQQRHRRQEPAGRRTAHQRLVHRLAGSAGGYAGRDGADGP